MERAAQRRFLRRKPVRFSGATANAMASMSNASLSSTSLRSASSQDVAAAVPSMDLLDLTGPLGVNEVGPHRVVARLKRTGPHTHGDGGGTRTPPGRSGHLVHQRAPRDGHVSAQQRTPQANPRTKMAAARPPRLPLPRNRLPDRLGLPIARRHHGRPLRRRRPHSARVPGVLAGAPSSRAPVRWHAHCRRDQASGRELADPTRHMHVHARQRCVRRGGACHCRATWFAQTANAGWTPILESDAALLETASQQVIAMPPRQPGAPELARVPINSGRQAVLFFSRRNIRMIDLSLTSQVVNFLVTVRPRCSVARGRTGGESGPHTPRIRWGMAQPLCAAAVARAAWLARDIALSGGKVGRGSAPGRPIVVSAARGKGTRELAGGRPAERQPCRPDYPRHRPTARPGSLCLRRTFGRLPRAAADFLPQRGANTHSGAWPPHAPTIRWSV